MQRKKWTPRTDVTDELVEFREKRKWQIALRRYVLEGQRSSYYAPFFGIDSRNFRKWIEIQFDQGMGWDNFSQKWQLDHIVPLVYFDFRSEKDLRLCWNFTNIRPASLGPGGAGLDALVAKSHFRGLYEHAALKVCAEMLKKLEDIELAEASRAVTLGRFLGVHASYLAAISGFSSTQYESLNEGVGLDKILAEKDFLDRFRDRS